MFKVGLTGGIGSGKSYIAGFFEKKGIPVYYADKEAKRLMYRNKALKKRIQVLFGKQAYHRNGRLNRAYIASIIFQDKSMLKKLNAIVHPAVGQDFVEWANNQNALYVIEESALIFEIDGQDNFDKTILVVADKEVRFKRVMKRDKSTREQVKARMDKQFSDKKKKGLADYIISNSEGDNIEDQVEKIHRLILKEK